ncbi:MurR/RpiR family transcriptional regulator [Thaumasiovibrio subtropicus]|uniref:MurR/RpiR family transcriptional regulator n=1 Tax=Thaumasiovibrio subtropicus TaxID=1891207 RepID=UPI00131BC0AA|nr:MurR/RpiR family transcriptional regulator [Thaumasiovibrio subtropicus]
MTKIDALRYAGVGKDQRLAQTLGDLNYDIAPYSAVKLGSMCQMSNATVVRFAQRLGFNGYADFKVALLAELRQQPAMPIFQGLEAEDDTQSMIAKSAQLFSQHIESSLKLLEAEVVEQAAEVITRANKIVLLGVGSSAVVANDIFNKLLRLNLPVQFTPDAHLQLACSNLVAEGDVVIAVSARGETKEVICALQNSRRKGAVSIGLTRFGRDTVGQLVDLHLPFRYNEDHSQMGVVTSQVMQMITFDVLFYKLNALLKDHQAIANGQEAVNQYIKGQ